MSDQKKWLDDDEVDGAIVTKKKPKTTEPRMYAVILLNDDYTPMEFVVWLVQNVFHKNEQEATQLMLDIHRKGRGVCGIFPYDVAQTKMIQVKNVAEKQEHPLECVIEPV